MWIRKNPNPCRTEEPDCVVRAIAIATGRTWDEVHFDLCELSREYCTMPSVNWLWGLYLKRGGFERFSLPENCPECITVRDFCRMFPTGRFVIGTGSHAVAVMDGDYYDAWNSGDEVIEYIFKEKERR